MCNCPPGSPFHWKKDKSPSVFARDQRFSVGKANSAIGATQRIEELRSQGHPSAVIKGISRDREAETLRIRMFTTFLRAKPAK